jgi:catechol 2,3-dioxygenase-like lactoylglutathione lyase family enzyme
MKPGLETRVAGLIVALIVLCAACEAQQLKATRVDAPGFTVSDMNRSIEFYSRVLHFKKVADRQTAGARVVRMQLGDEQIELTQYDSKGQLFPPDSRGNDHWFQHIAIVVSDMQKAYSVLRRNRVRHASSAPQRLPDWNQNAAGIEAFYFRDSDGHYLELIHFPAGKGAPKWQRPSQELFLGIDHTAIVVTDTDQSLRFYRDVLEMHVVGESENYGVEQEHLNGIFGAHLLITSLRAEGGPGIELLEYLSPTDGRVIPPDLRANDIAHWETHVEFEDNNVADHSSFSDINFTARHPGSDNEFLTEDPDRHVIILHGAKPNTTSRIRPPVGTEQ